MNNISPNIHPSIAWFVRAITGRLLRTCTVFFLWHILIGSLAQNTFTSSMILSEFAYHPPPSTTWKRQKNSENIFFFFIIFFFFYNFFYSSAASKRAFCLIYPSGAIFCFKCASLAIENITKWFFRGRLTWEIGWTENRRTPLDIQSLYRVAHL